MTFLGHRGRATLPELRPASYLIPSHQLTENAVVVSRVDKVTLPFVKEEVARMVLVPTSSKKFIDLNACGFLGLTTEPLFDAENDCDSIRIYRELVAERNR